ncbi:MAG: NUDIX domain-containing protein [Planctomycetales bacterium]|nr:NUDIX domain-containing protein [Planctomycetales bacterium]
MEHPQNLQDVFCYCPQCGNGPSPTVPSAVGPFSCAECGFVLYFGPRVAVGALVFDANQRLLFIRRNRDPGKGKLGLPGGFVDPGEGVEEATIREVAEEVSLEVTNLEYLCSAPNIYTYKGISLPVADVFFVCQVKATDHAIPEQHEISECFFAELTSHHIRQMAFSSNQSALEYYLAQGSRGPSSC